MESMFFVWSTTVEKEGGWKKSAWTAEAQLFLSCFAQDGMDGSVGKGRVVDSVCLSKALDTVPQCSSFKCRCHGVKVTQAGQDQWG